MDKVKRILAIIGIVILVGLYVTTLILAIVGGENTEKWFTGCIVATIFVPIMIYVYQWLYKLVKKQADEARNPEEMVIKNPEDNSQEK